MGLGLAPLSGAALLVGPSPDVTGKTQRDPGDRIDRARCSEARTLGHLLGPLAVVPLAVVIVTVYMVYLFVLGGTGSPTSGSCSIGPLVVGMAAVVGVAAGTWFPNRFGGLVGLGALAGVQIAFQDAEGTGTGSPGGTQCSGTAAPICGSDPHGHTWVI